MYPMTLHPVLNGYSPAETLVNKKPSTICKVLLLKDSTFPSSSSWAKETLANDTAVYVRNHRPNGTWRDSIIRARRGPLDVIFDVFELPPLENNVTTGIRPSNQQILHLKCSRKPLKDSRWIEHSKVVG
ncbi:unnamed protein product [Hymenolepis diminuta]|uniref:Uncharacterized protein n=1 Tax=Hymenolepis diminuta TaxID=6216 RepID=A0A564YS40_HYMDI|nr:unnamed protein product [Hymenolepis diminuta]